MVGRPTPVIEMHLSELEDKCATAESVPTNTILIRSLSRTMTWFDIDGLRIHCLTAGECGPPLVLLHGGGIDNATLSWKPCLKHLSNHFRVFAPDLPGYGRSSKPPVEYTFNYYVNFLSSFLDAIEYEQASIGGLSLGGGISLAFALEQPSRIDRLVQIASYAFLPRIPYHRLAYVYVQTPINELSYWLFGRSRRVVRWSLQSGLLYDPTNVSADLVEAVYREAQRPGAGMAFISFQRSDIRWNSFRSNLRNQFSNVIVPTLLINGAEDTAVPPSAAKNAHALIPNSQLQIIEQAKHWVPREHPEKVSHHIRSFLET